jgi:hypothetical protein
MLIYDEIIGKNYMIMILGYCQYLLLSKHSLHSPLGLLITFVNNFQLNLVVMFV